MVTTAQSLRLQLVAVFVLITLSHCQDSNDICYLPSCNLLFKPYVDDFCSLLIHGREVKGRCCCEMGNNATIVAIDLSSCQLQSIGSMIREQAPKVQKINFINNPNLVLNETDFTGLKDLRILKLPKTKSCPGSHDWFNQSSWRSWRNVTLGEVALSCTNQTDTCSELRHNYNYTCPDHSECHNNGPGQFLCLCVNPWSGYKCLKMTVDRSIYIYILLSTAVPSGLLSLLGWCTMRRHAI